MEAPPPHEREVNEIVAALYTGKANLHVRVAEDADTGELFGMCGMCAKPLVMSGPYQPMLDAAYVCVIAISETCRGKYRLPDGTRLGDFLLHDALIEIQTQWGGGAMPPVWALIAPANVASHNLFADHGFGLIPAGPTGKYDVRLRPRALPLAP